MLLLFRRGASFFRANGVERALPKTMRLNETSVGLILEAFCINQDSLLYEVLEVEKYYL